MDIDKVFEDLKNIVSNYYSIPLEQLNGINKLKARWRRGKRWMLPFFDSNGRIVIKADSGIESITKPDTLTAIERLRDTGYQLTLKHRFSVIHPPTIYKRLQEVLEKFTVDEIVSNRIESTSVQFYGTDRSVPKGTKLSKYISQIPASFFDQPYEEDEETIIDYVNTLFSALVSSLTPNATIVLSINPIDFLLSSDHTTGWTSCHSFAYGGSRTGSLAYMCDKESAIAYAYSSTGEISTTGIQWPIKIWRQMVFFDAENLCAVHSRNYPQEHALFEKYARRLSAKVLSELGNTEFKWFTSSSTKGNLEETQHIHFDVKGRSSFSYVDRVSSRIRMKKGNKINTLKVGTTALPCLICGTSRRSGKNRLFCCN